MMEKINLKDNKVLGFKKNIVFKKLSYDERSKLLRDYQFSEVFLEECKANVYYSFSEIYINQLLPDEYIERDLEGNSEYNSYIWEHYNNHATHLPLLEHIYYFLISSNYPNEKYLKQNMDKFDEYIYKVSGSSLECPWIVFFENENISDELIEFVINYYKSYKNERIVVDLEMLVEDLYIYRENLSEYLKSKYENPYQIE